MKSIRLLPALLAVLALAGSGPRVADWDRLIERDGMTYDPVSGEAFTGTGIRYWPNGRKELEAEFVDGRLHGPAAAWYECGRQQTENIFRDGKWHGTRTGWYPNGQKQFESEYREGRKRGRTIIWREDGSKEEEADFLDGREHGRKVLWYGNGRKEYEGEYRHGLNHGKYTWWYENGTKMEEGTEVDGKPHGKVVAWHENGVKKAEVDYRDGVEIGAKRWDREGNEIVYPPEPEGFTRMLGDMLMVNWDALMESLYDPEMVSDFSDVGVEDGGMQYLYAEFLRTVVPQSRPGGYRVLLAEKGRETLNDVHDLLRIVHNLDLAISGERAAPWMAHRYGPLLNVMAAALLVDRLTLPLVLAGDDTRDLEWFEYHQYYMGEAARAYAAIFPDPGAPLESYTHPATGVAFPDAIATLARGRVKDTGDPGSAAQVHYAGPGVKATVYLYRGGLDSIPGGLDSAELKDEFESTVRTIIFCEEAGYYANLEKLAEGEAPWGEPGSGARSLHASFSYSDHRAECLSHLYLRPYKNHFLKVRFTYDRPAREEAEKILEEFLTVLGKLTPAN